MHKITEFKVCEQCNGPCEAIHCKANVWASEWYCEKCHKSYDMYAPDKQEEEEDRGGSV